MKRKHNAAILKHSLMMIYSYFFIASLSVSGFL